MLAVDLINHTAPWVGSPPKLKGYWPELRITYDPELARSLDSAGRATRQKGQCNGRGILPALVEAGPARSRVFALFPPSPRGCWCPPGLHPPNCTLTPLPAKRCIGGCSNAGQCIAGTCVCNAGRSGIDCGRSVHADAAGAIAAQEASARAPSPRIYVYELPAEYTTWLALSPSANDPGAEGMWWQGLDPVYSADLRLLNRLLVSPHRTLDPARADFYYVPMLLSLGFISHRFGIYLPSAPAARVINRTIAHIRSAYPYWNRSDGADHIFMFTGDDGAAWLRGRLPLLEHAIFLTHWGMQCNDRTLRKRGRRHCVTAQIGFRSHHSGQDIVLPPLHKPQTLLPASAWLRPTLSPPPAPMRTAATTADAAAATATATVAAAGGGANPPWVPWMISTRFSALAPLAVAAVVVAAEVVAAAHRLAARAVPTSAAAVAAGATSSTLWAR